MEKSVVAEANKKQEMILETLRKAELKKLQKDQIDEARRQHKLKMQQEALRMSL
jgi:hypothetical protein